MGRNYTRENKVQTHAWINRALDFRLKQYSKEFGFSKNRLIEDAIMIWLNQRDAEKHK
jgi:hypothetical protein